ncbi:hypothetical protein GVN16_21130 [Emticicia sp. CRIBPO]|uniref:VCBS domain-containing protein n=1 Tax=Emticicia sp. CRIBPO TaxID=2683258 RepID=UPI001411D023|nr:VCBS domain-containing protein [Emticicia sp. CRIBPO]NBA88289.1 hypothetical protein [Emticicia sp. CRIBPO]
MTTKDLKLELKPLGSILDCRVFLETHDEIGLWVYNTEGKYFYKNLPNYPIDGTSLEVTMIAKGKNGASTKLTIKIKGQPDETLTCLIKEGSDIEQKSIIISNI